MLGISFNATGQRNTEGTITPKMLEQIKKSVDYNSDTKALINAVTNAARLLEMGQLIKDQNESERPN